MIIDLFHNIRWSKYKAAVFSELHLQAVEREAFFTFVQIADTDSDRTVLSGVDISYHQYPHDLLFAGSYGAVPKWEMVRTLFSKVWCSNAKLVLLPGFERLEYWAMLMACILTGKKRAVFCDSTIHDRPQSWFKGIFKRIFFSLCNAYFCYGQRSKEYLIHYGAASERVFHRRQAAALVKSYSVTTALDARQKMAVAASTPRYLYVGRLSPEKSLPVLLQAFSGVRASLPTAKLILVGAGPQRSELESLVAALDLGAAVEFAGSMGPEGLAQQYAMATCLVLPSRSEPWGLVVNEALHYGCPVVVSDHCGCVPELVHNDASGLSFVTDDVDDLQQKLLLAPSQFADTQRVAERCFEVIAGYTPETTARQILDGCESILGGTRSA